MAPSPRVLAWLALLLLPPALVAADATPAPGPTPAPAPAPAPVPAPTPPATDAPAAPRLLLGVQARESHSNDPLADAVAPPAIIDEVVKGSNAERIGLKAGDTITKINDQAIKDFGDVIRFIHGATAGEAVTIAVTRAGQQVTLTGVLRAQAPAKSDDVLP